MSSLFISHSMSSFCDKAMINAGDKLIIDAGSGKIKAFYVQTSNDSKKLTIKDITSERVSHQICVSESTDSTLSKECQTKGEQVFKSILSKWEVDCTVVSCIGVATAWARNANNSKEYLEKLKEIGIDIKIMSQTDEGHMGYNSAISALKEEKLPTENALIWDMGGGSFQLSYKNQDTDIVIIEGPYGADNFKKAIQDCLSDKGFKNDFNNRFLTHEELPVAKECARDLISPYLPDKHDLSSYRIYAIEAFFHLGIKPLFHGANEILTSNIDSTLQELLNYDFKTAEDVFKINQAAGVEYNLLLMQSILEPMEIGEITLLDTNRSLNILEYHRQHECNDQLLGEAAYHHVSAY